MSALGRNNTDKVSQEIQYQTAALFTTYSGGGASVSFINWWAGSFESPALAKLAVVFTIASYGIPNATIIKLLIPSY